MRADQIALQLYTLREPAQRDFRDTLRQVADLGYGAVELAGLYGVPAAELRQLLDELGLRAISAHVLLSELDTRADSVVADLRALGCETLVVPWVGEERRASPTAVRGLAADLNRWGARLRDEGLRLAYHHHNFEFEPLEDTTMWAILTAELDPALVGLEIDVYWAARGGHDPAALVAQLARSASDHRGPAVTLIHLKDLGPDGADLPVGEGGLDWGAILDAARAAGAAWYIAELDNPRDPFEDMRRARAYLVARAAPPAGEGPMPT